MSEAQQKALELKNAGNEFFAKGEHKKAIESFTEAIALDPTNHVLHSNRAASHTSLRDFSNALLDAEKTIELNPSFVKGYVRKAVALYYLRRFDEAETVYKHLMEIDPSLSGHSVGRQQSALGTAVSKAIPDGTWGQLVAPFSSEAPHGIVSEAVAPACDWLLDRGCVGVISVGPAAEMTKLTPQERVDLSKLVADHFGSKCPSIAFADVSVKDLPEHIVQLALSGAKTIILPLVAPFFEKNISTAEFTSRITDLVAKLSVSAQGLPIILGLAELSSALSIPPATLSAAFAAAPGHLGLFIDHSAGMSSLKAKKDVVPTHAKMFGSTLSNLIESWTGGINGYTGIAGAFFPHIIQWTFVHYHDKVELNQQRSSMIQRFLSIAELTVKRYFPINAKMYLKITNDAAFDDLNIVTRQQHQPDDIPGEEDIVRLTHLHELVHYVMDGLKEEDKPQGARRDASLLL